MIEGPESREWDLGGRRLLLDYSYGLQMWWSDSTGGNNDLSVSIAVPFTVYSDGREFAVDPEDVTTLVPALGILHQFAERLTASRSGRLELLFRNGLSIVVENDPRFESWEAQDSGEFAGIRLLCSGHDGPPWDDGLRRSA